MSEYLCGGYSAAIACVVAPVIVASGYPHSTLKVVSKVLQLAVAKYKTYVALGGIWMCVMAFCRLYTFIESLHLIGVE